MGSQVQKFYAVRMGTQVGTPYIQTKGIIWIINLMTFGRSAQTWEQPPTHTKAQLEVHIKRQKEIHVWQQLKLQLKVHIRVQQWVHLKNEGIICALTDYAFLGWVVHIEEQPPIRHLVRAWRHL